jgi:pimeloyl-ACP methyl ester carboxylesterase
MVAPHSPSIDADGGIRSRPTPASMSNPGAKSRSVAAPGRDSYNRRMIWSTLLKGALRAVHGPLPPPPQPGPEAGLVMVADGVGGLDLCATGLQYAAARAGLPHPIRIVSWGHGFGRWHRDLTDVANHAARAEALAEEIRAFRGPHPEAPVFLVGKSGGTGIVVRALERLPADSVERAVLIASALSPGYDLSRALRACRRDMVVFWSPLDVVILGAGTRLFGTVDRVGSVAAGMVGFRPPDSADPAQYAKLRPVKWHPKMGATGYLGGHVGPDNPRFLQRYVVPLLDVREDPPMPVSSPARAAPIT